ncbi:MAG: hypothetical protein KAS17_07175 [Victivallaceae bacterium]|nr:hypothetical protein [Victivallaceae bacterium]
MANICDLQINLTFENDEDAKAFETFFREEIAEATKNNIGIYIGSERYLFDVDLDSVIETEAVIFGNVKWALNGEEAEKFIRFINDCRKLVRATISYEESGCCIFGKYVYGKSVLQDTYVPYDHAIWSKDGIFEAIDSSYEELDQAMDDDGITNQIATI